MIMGNSLADYFRAKRLISTMNLKKKKSCVHSPLLNWFLTVLVPRCWLFWLPSIITLSATCFMSFPCCPTVWGWWYQYCLSYQFLHMLCGVFGRRKEVSKMWVSESSVLADLLVFVIYRDAWTKLLEWINLYLFKT